MRVMILPDPVQFERPGGLRAQACETMDALARRGHEVTRAHALPQPGACDVLHVFGVARGHGRMTSEAVARGLAVVLAPRLSPAWNSANGTRARVADRLLGNRSTGQFDTGYAQIRQALRDAHVLAALGESERKSIHTAFLVRQDKVRLVPNGVAARFEQAGAALFRARAGVQGRFALVLGQVSPWNGQLEVASALAPLALPLVVAGAIAERDAGYAAALRALPLVTLLGQLEHDAPLLASAHAAASVLVVAGQGSALPGAALASLAAGTPVVATWRVAGLAPGQALRVVVPDNRVALAAAVADLLADPPPAAAVRAAARPFGWDATAALLEDCYREAVSAASCCRVSVSYTAR